MGIFVTVALFIGFACIIAIAGYELVKYADKLADITGIGEALFGAILLGAITSLAGIITSVTAALQSHPHLAISNAMGGIAAQTLFLALVDISYRKANLEHSSASYANLLVGLLLIIMLSFILFVILIAYSLCLGLRLLEVPKWQTPSFQINNEKLMATHDAYFGMANAKGKGRSPDQSLFS